MAPAADATVRTTPPDDQRLIEALRAGDEAAFNELVSRYGASMLRVASSFVRSRAVAEEVVQETWLAVLNGLDRFEGRSSLRSWIFAILANRARTRAVREARSVPFSSLAGGDDGPTVDPALFEQSGRWAGHWISSPEPWALPEDELVSRETRALVTAAIEALPPGQRAVITLRDVEGWPSEEVSELLEITPGNQRVLLHRARSKVRGELERYLGSDP
jgi:RNA polymerase sigma-70 factor (ECF subfamily)